MGLVVTAVGLEKKSVGPELKKHAATIHCSNTLSLLQRKISNALLYHAYKELMLKEEHEINIKQLCQLISYHGNNHGAIREALKGLLSTVIEWNVVSDTVGSEDWTASSILASVSLQGPVCFYAYSPRMKQLLHSPSMFGKINLFIQSRFKSSYGLALYENCIRYKSLPFTKWLEMDAFRKLMGVPVEKYTVFRDFKRRVLDKSVEEVNTYSDLIVTPEILREGRQVVKIRFALKERAKKARLGNKVAEETQDFQSDPIHSQLMSEFGLSSEQAEQVTQEYSSDFIAEKIAVIATSKNYQQGKVQNLTAYFLSALKNDYRPGKASVDRVKAEKQVEHEHHWNLKKLQETVGQVREMYLSYREKTIDVAIEALTELDKKHLIDQFYTYAATSIKTILKLQRNKYTHETILHSPQIKALLRQFALQSLSTLQEKLISLEKFLENLSVDYRDAWQKLMEMDPEHPLLQ